MRATSPITRAALLVSALGLMLAGTARSASEWKAVDEVVLGSFAGEARLVGDPDPLGRGRHAVLEIEGRRFETWAFGGVGHRLGALRSGDVIGVAGTRVPFDEDRARRSNVRHLVGRFDVIDTWSVEDSHRRASALVRAANRVRQALEDGSGHMDGERASLFTGLVYGDDSSQSKAMVEEFRSSGLAHLTAVSGQNVVFVLSAFGPLLRRMPRTPRIGSTIAVLAWFAVMTRLEPSVVRAVIMAGVSAVMVGAGRPVSSWTALCATVSAATLVDPFLVWSVGWWLSVFGCAGLIAFTKPISGLLERWPEWVSSIAAPTIAAQTGVLVVLVAVFGWPSALAVPSNLLAAPVAGLVMLVGMPVALAASFVPASIGELAMLPLEVGVSWVAAVASAGADLDPPLAVDVSASLAWVCVVAWSLLRWRRSMRAAGVDRLAGEGGISPESM